MIGYSVGGGYDVYARLIARHLGKHIPGNPIVTPKNMEGAGSLRLANWLYNVAPKDGTVFGIIGRGIPFDPLLGGSGQFDATKFSWIGSANDEVSICAAWHATPVNTFEDLLTRDMIVGGTASGADTDQFPKIVNGVLGAKMRVISGYPGGNEITLAMERGEVQGRCGWSWSSVKATHPTWVQDKKIKILMQLSLAKHPDLPDVPLIMDLAKNDEQRQILKLVFARQVMGRPFLGPPGIPDDRLTALRKAFMDTMKDPEFLAEAEKGKLEITPVSGEDIQKLVTEVYATPKDVAAKAGAMLK
jgi:tripartite-type tricarboxylate transporter receptor subunit TctC